MIRKRAGDIIIMSGTLKESHIDIQVDYNKDCSESIELRGYDELCDLEYLIKTVKRAMNS